MSSHLDTQATILDKLYNNKFYPHVEIVTFVDISPCLVNDAFVLRIYFGCLSNKV